MEIVYIFSIYLHKPPKTILIMLQRGFFKSKRQSEPKSNRFIKTVSNILLYLGVIIIITSLIYILVNINNADALIVLWLVFMLTGLFLVVMSHMIKWIFR